MISNEDLTKIINSYSWIKIKKYEEEAPSNPNVDWRDSYFNLLKHHKEETEFLIGTCRNLSQELLDERPDYISKFEDNDWNHLHDVVLSATGKKSTREELIQIYRALPEDLKSLANQWGMNDTVFRENVYNYLM